MESSYASLIQPQKRVFNSKERITPSFIMRSVTNSCRAHFKLSDKASLVSCAKEDIEEMLSKNLPWNDRHNRNALLEVIKACGKRKDLNEARRLHAEIVRENVFSKDTCINNALVTLYVKCGDLIEAKKTFDQVLIRNVVSWNALISGYVKNGHSYEALNCFKQMCDDGISPSEVTFVCVLKACGNVGSIEIGKEIHTSVAKQGLLKKNIILGTTLVDMYAKCNMLDKAQEVFDEISLRDVVAWNALIAGYTQQGFANEALKCFKKMQCDGLLPDAVTYVCILKACSTIGLVNVGEEIHTEVRKRGLLRKNIVLCTALVDMYVKCNRLEKAREVFDLIEGHDVTSWSVLISGYSQNGLGDEALNCFIRMREEGIIPDAITYIGILKACGSVGCLEMGEEIHEEVKKQGLLGKEVALGTALVDMYAKCGVLGEAHKVFDMLPVQNVASWTALMTAYAQSGKAGRVLELFTQLISRGITPDLVTILVVLSACNHAGLVDEGQIIFDVIEQWYCLDPSIEHYNCMVDLFSRAGHFDKALDLIEKVPTSNQRRLWLSLLGACCKWVNVELGRWAFIRSVSLDEDCDAAYVYMGNIYAAAGMQKEADEIEACRVSISGNKEKYHS